jgi:hypothetical protein
MVHELHYHLKKQSQFPKGQMNVTSIIGEDYVQNRVFRLRISKAKRRPLAGNPKFETRNPKRAEGVHLKKQSQFHGPYRFVTKGLDDLQAGKP